MSSSKNTPSPGAMRAAEAIARRYQLGPNHSTRKLIAITIDKETAAPDLLEAARDALCQLAYVERKSMSAFQQTNVPRAVKRLRNAINKAKQV
jgi:hypothetical protein